jgi:hypothetical protein
MITKFYKCQLYYIHKDIKHLVGKYENPIDFKQLIANFKTIEKATQKYIDDGKVLWTQIYLEDSKLEREITQTSTVLISRNSSSFQTNHASDE